MNFSLINAAIIFLSPAVVFAAMDMPETSELALLTAAIAVTALVVWKRKAQ